MQAAGSRLGTGTMIVLDDKTCPGRHAAQSGAFLRAGVMRLVHPLLVRAFLDRTDIAGHGGGPRQGFRPRTAGIPYAISWPGHTFCALAPGAAEPLQSGLKYFKDDFERHIHEKRCPWVNMATVCECEANVTTIHIDNRPILPRRREPVAGVPFAGIQPALFLLASGAGLGGRVPPVRGQAVQE